MRTLAFLAVVAACAACGGGNKKPSDGNGGGSDGPKMDAPPLVDAVPLPACQPQSGQTMSTRSIGQVSPPALLAVSPPNDGRLFVVEGAGRVRIFENEQLRSAPFFTMTGVDGDFAAGGEQGLLGLAFHPNYANNGYFYVFYTTGPCPGSPPPSGACANVVKRFTVKANDKYTADQNTGVEILRIPDFATNHNGGMMEFGSDGYLYIGTGDGGAGGDPAGNGQNPDRLLGKMLRIDVDHPAGGKMYGIPADNPYATTGGAPEVFMMGLRNPWRWTFDRATGDMYIGDVGQDAVEEVDVLPAGQQKGKNLGWSLCEAASNYSSTGCATPGLTAPQYTHAHPAWKAVIGGAVYRGPCYPDITGAYFFTDYSAHTLMKGVYASGTLTVTDVTPGGGFPTVPAAIHNDARGELYMTSTDGNVYHLEAGP